MDRIKLKSDAKEAIKGKVFSIFLFVFLLGLLSGLITGLINLIPIFRIETVSQTYNIFTNQVVVTKGQVSVLSIIASLLIAGPVAFAVSSGFLKVVEKKKAPKVIEEFKNGFSNGNLLRSFLGVLRVEVFTFLWSLLFVIPGIIKAISYSQTMFLLADNKDMTPAEAQKKSMELMNGHKMDYFVLQLSFIGWEIVTALTLGIASIYVVPYMQTTLAEFYKKLVAKK